MTSSNDTVRHRIPTRSDTWYLFLVCLFPVHIRAYLVFFYALPSYLLYIDIWGILGIFAYVQLLALLESLLFLAGLLFTNISLPREWFRQKFLPQGTVVMLASFLWIIPLHYQNQIVGSLSYNLFYYYILVAIWALSFLAVIIGAARRLRRKPGFEKFIRALAERLSPLSILYLAVDLLALIIIAIRLVS
jgi:hypothetical protein